MRHALAPVLILAAAGCAQEQGTYPSLGARPTEARGFEEPVAAAAPAAVADPVLDARLADAGQRLDTVAHGFDADAARADKAAATGGVRTVGSDAWVAAQSALATLDDWRAQAAGLATEVDGLARQRVEATGTPYPALDALNTRASAEAERESTTIAALGASLPQP